MHIRYDGPSYKVSFYIYFGNLKVGLCLTQWPASVRKPCSLVFYVLVLVLLCTRCMCIEGTIMNRHRVPKPPPDEDQFYRADDLNIGMELNFHSRVVKLVNCDEFTRNFLQKLGVRLNPPIQIPADPYSCERKAVSTSRSVCSLCLTSAC